jgi:Dolichyl-phosphate-mannose-protein mannosyltransferase
MPWSRLQLSLGLLVLLLGGVLRFAHLDHGLRHVPHTDENYFVEPAARMRASGSLDPGWHQYPGLMFYALLPLVAPAEGHEAPGPEAYLAPRRLIAGCGVLALALVLPFGRRLVGPWGALLAAALLAVSPVHVETAHSLRPDVVLECLTLLLLLALLRLDGSPRRDLQAGGALGLAMGLKYSAILSGVPLLLSRLSTPRRRWMGLLTCAAAAGLVFLLCSPYMLWNWDGFLDGILTQVGYHYQEQPATLEPYASRLLAYAGVWPKALGWPAALMALAGLWLALRSQPRRFLPFVVLPPLTAAVFATSGYLFNRHLVPSMGVVALLAGLPVESLRRRGRGGAGLALALALAAPLPSLLATAHYLRSIGRPTTFDRAADWVSAQLPGPARVLTDQPRLGFPPRFEVLRLRPDELDVPTLELLVPEVQAVVSEPLPEAAALDLPQAAIVERPASNPWGGPPVLELRLGRPAATRVIDLAGARLSASASGERLENLRDGDLDSYWEVEARRGQVEWIGVELPRAVRLVRVELLLGSRPRDAGRGLTLKIALPDGEYAALRSVPVRPATRDQRADLGGYSERLAMRPVLTRSVRIERSAGARRWSVAELRLEAEGGTPAVP